MLLLSVILPFEPCFKIGSMRDLQCWIRLKKTTWAEIEWIHSLGLEYQVVPREMENISRSPTSGDFVTIRTESSMQDVKVERLQSTRVQTPLYPPSLKYYVLRESLSVDSQNIPCAISGCTYSQCCGSGMFIPDPDFYPFRIPDPKTATKERGEKKISCHSHKLKNWKLFKLWNAEENNLGQFSKNYRIFTQKLSQSSQKYGFGIRDPEKTYSVSRIPDPGAKKTPDPGSRIRDTAYSIVAYYYK